MPNVKTEPLKVQKGDDSPSSNLAESGLLSFGFHTCTLAELRPLVTSNPHRDRMWQKLISFISWPILTRKFSYVFISGGYISLNETPDDIDVVLQTRETFARMPSRRSNRFSPSGWNRSARSIPFTFISGWKTRRRA
jgi:hypothetical protein